MGGKAAQGGLEEGGRKGGKAAAEEELFITYQALSRDP